MYINTFSDEPEFFFNLQPETKKLHLSLTMLWRREYWRIYRGPAFLAVGWFGSTPPFTPPLPSVRLSLFRSLPVCRRPSLLTREGDKGWPKSQIIRPRESMVLCALFNTRCSAQSTAKKEPLKYRIQIAKYSYLRLATNTGVKGTVAWDGFFPFGHVLEGYLGFEFFWFSTKIRRDRLNFMSIGVFSMYGQNTLYRKKRIWKSTLWQKKALYFTRNIFSRQEPNRPELNRQTGSKPDIGAPLTDKRLKNYQMTACREKLFVL